METYEAILERMRAEYEKKSGSPPEDASDLGLRLQILAGELYRLQGKLDWLKRQAFPHTARGVQLDLHGAQRGVKRRGALRGWDKEDPLLQRLEAGRAQVKKTMGDLGKCLGGSRAGNRRELEGAGPLLKYLAELTLDFAQRYREKKLEKNFLDYSDLEHQAIRLFCKEDGTPTAAAL